MHIFIDADACPVKPEVYRVAHRYKWRVTRVAGARMRIPDRDGIKVFSATLMLPAISIQNLQISSTSKT